MTEKPAWEWCDEVETRRRKAGEQRFILVLDPDEEAVTTISKFAAKRELSAASLRALGAFFGPFLGVTLSLVAVRHTLTGVAASLMATTPLLIIPLVVLLRREHVGVAGIGGAVLVVLGVALLFV